MTGEEAVAHIKKNGEAFADMHAGYLGDNFFQAAKLQLGILLVLIPFELFMLSTFFSNYSAFFITVFLFGLAFLVLAYRGNFFFHLQNVNTVYHGELSNLFNIEDPYHVRIMESWAEEFMEQYTKHGGIPISVLYRPLMYISKHDRQEERARAFKQKVDIVSQSNTLNSQNMNLLKKLKGSL